MRGDCRFGGLHLRAAVDMVAGSGIKLISCAACHQPDRHGLPAGRRNALEGVASSDTAAAGLTMRDSYRIGGFQLSAAVDAVAGNGTVLISRAACHQPDRHGLPAGRPSTPERVAPPGAPTAGLTMRDSYRIGGLQLSAAGGSGAVAIAQAAATANQSAARWLLAAVRSKASRLRQSRTLE
jgi:hypothetical protein